jgi:hypothetical protein
MARVQLGLSKTSLSVFLCPRFACGWRFFGRTNNRGRQPCLLHKTTEKIESSRSDGWVPVRLEARASIVKWRVIAYVGDGVIADLPILLPSIIVLLSSC